MIDTIDSTTGRFALLCIVWATAYAAAAAMRPAKPKMMLHTQNITKHLDIWRMEHLSTGIGTDSSKVVTLRRTYGTARFGEVWIANDAAEPAEQSIGKDVAAQISFYALSGNKVGKPMRWGRWAEKKHPTSREELGPLSVTDFPPNGIPKALNIALKPKDDPNCYGFSNETILKYAKGWKDKHLVLPSGEYMVRIALRGTNVKDDIWLKLVNPGASSDGFVLMPLNRKPLLFRLRVLTARVLGRKNL